MHILQAVSPSFPLKQLLKIMYVCYALYFKIKVYYLTVHLHECRILCHVSDLFTLILFSLQKRIHMLTRHVICVYALHYKNKTQINVLLRLFALRYLLKPQRDYFFYARKRVLFLHNILFIIYLQSNLSFDSNQKARNCDIQYIASNNGHQLHSLYNSSGVKNGHAPRVTF